MIIWITCELMSFSLCVIQFPCYWSPLSDNAADIINANSNLSGHSEKTNIHLLQTAWTCLQYLCNLTILTCKAEARSPRHGQDISYDEHCYFLLIISSFLIQFLLYFHSVWFLWSIHYTCKKNVLSHLQSETWLCLISIIIMRAS